MKNLNTALLAARNVFTRGSGYARLCRFLLMFAILLVNRDLELVWSFEVYSWVSYDLGYSSELGKLANDLLAGLVVLIGFWLWELLLLSRYGNSSRRKMEHVKKFFRKCKIPILLSRYGKWARRKLEPGIKVFRKYKPPFRLVEEIYLVVSIPLLLFTSVFYKGGGRHGAEIGYALMGILWVLTFSAGLILALMAARERPVVFVTLTVTVLIFGFGPLLYL